MSPESVQEALADLCEDSDLAAVLGARHMLL
jgi:hypothetical protein